MQWQQNYNLNTSAINNTRGKAVDCGPTQNSVNVVRYWSRVCSNLTWEFPCRKNWRIVQALLY
jgi:hypothetical protein